VLVEGQYAKGRSKNRIVDERSHAEGRGNDKDVDEGSHVERVVHIVFTFFVGFCILFSFFLVFLQPDTTYFS